MGPRQGGALPEQVGLDLRQGIGRPRRRDGGLACLDDPFDLVLHVCLHLRLLSH